MTWIDSVPVLLPVLSVLISAAVAVLIGFTLLWTQRAVVGSVVPQIECYLRPLASNPGICEFVIANTGLGSAKNVSYRFECDEEDFKAHSVWLTKRVTDPPFQVIVGKSEITSKFGSFVPLLEEPPLKPFQVVVDYEWKPFYRTKWKHEQRIFALDAAPFTEMIPDWEKSKNEVAEILKQHLPGITDAIKDLARKPIDPQEVMDRIEARDARLRREGRA